MRSRYSVACVSYHDVLDKRVAANKEATKPRVSIGYVVVITSKDLQSSHDLVNRKGIAVSRVCSVCRNHNPIHANICTHSVNPPPITTH